MSPEKRRERLGATAPARARLLLFRDKGLECCSRVRRKGPGTQMPRSVRCNTGIVLAWGRL